MSSHAELIFVSFCHFLGRDQLNKNSYLLPCLQLLLLVCNHVSPLHSQCTCLLAMLPYWCTYSRESIKLLFLLFLSWVTGADQLKCTFTWNTSLQWTVKLDTIIIALNLVIQSYYDKSAKATYAGNTAYVARKRT